MSSRRCKIWRARAVGPSGRWFPGLFARPCKGERPRRAGTACPFSRLMPMRRSSPGIARKSCSRKIACESRIVGYERARGTRLAEPSISRRSPSLVWRGGEAWVGHLCAHPARVCPAFVQSSFHFKSSAPVRRGGTSCRSHPAQTTSFLAFARSHDGEGFSTGPRPSAGERRLSCLSCAEAKRPARYF